MPTRPNRYFNDPNMAAAFSNLAGIFAPPSAQDFYAMSRTEGQDFQNQASREAWAALTAAGVTPQDQDRFGIAMTTFGQGFAPTSSNRAIDVASADRRYGVDVGAATAARGQDMDFALGLPGIGSALEYEDATAGLPPEMAEALGLEFSLPPQTGAGLGAPAPALTEAEIQAREMQRLLGEGLITDDMLIADIMSGAPVENVVGPDGTPVITYRSDAVGQEPYVNPGSQAAPTAITFDRNGQRIGGFVVDGQFVDATGAPLTPEEAGTATRIGQPQGSNEELGVTNSNQTDYNRVQQTVTVSNALIDDLEGLIRSRAGAAGLPGTIQMLGQDIVQVARELGTAFGDNPDAIVTPDMLSQIAGDGSSYDPVFREIRSGMLQLAYLNAQRDNPRGEVSRFALERQIEALGQGAFANDQAVLAALGMSRRANDRAVLGAEALVGRPAGAGGTGAPAAPAPAAAPPTTRPRATNPETDETVEWNGQEWVPVQ